MKGKGMHKLCNYTLTIHLITLSVWIINLFWFTMDIIFIIICFDHHQVHYEYPHLIKVHLNHCGLCGNRCQDCLLFHPDLMHIVPK